jgi:hypothetical protein
VTLRDFFLGGSALRVLMFALGIAYCIRAGRARSLIVLAHSGSIVVLIVIVFSREWGTLLGLPVTALVVWLLTELVALRRAHERLRAGAEDQHAINEHLLEELARRK